MATASTCTSAAPAPPVYQLNAGSLHSPPSRLDAHIERQLGEAASVRRTFVRPPPPPPAANAIANGTAAGAEGASGASGGGADGSAANSTEAGAGQQQRQQPKEEIVISPAEHRLDFSLDLRSHPEVAPLADAAFTLAALLASGAAAPWGLPANDPRAVYVLHRAALAGSQDARLALADRYLTGRGLPQLWDEGLRHAKAAASVLMDELDEAGGPKQGCALLWRAGFRACCAAGACRAACGGASSGPPPACCHCTHA